MRFKSRERLALDLGTETTRVYLPDRGVVLKEPTVTVISAESQHVLAVGSEAEKMTGRTPIDITAVRLVRAGVIAEFDLARIFIKQIISQVVRVGWFFRPEVLAAVPMKATKVEKQALVEVLVSSGVKTVYLIDQPIAAAAGSQVPMAEPVGSLILNIGGGLTEIALISMGNVISFRSINFGGRDMTKMIINYLSDQHNLAVGFQSAEMIKQVIGSLEPFTQAEIANLKMALKKDRFQMQEGEVLLEVSGRDLITGLPRRVMISSAEIRPVLIKAADKIIKIVRQIMHDIPPELVTDVMDKGIVMVGGGSLVKHFNKHLTNVIGVPCYPADQPQECVIKGSGKILENLDLFSYAYRNEV